MDPQLLSNPEGPFHLGGRLALEDLLDRLLQSFLVVPVDLFRLGDQLNQLILVGPVGPQLLSSLVAPWGLFPLEHPLVLLILVVPVDPQLQSNPADPFHLAGRLGLGVLSRLGVL